jgi:hypothetical protein
VTTKLAGGQAHRREQDEGDGVTTLEDATPTTVTPVVLGGARGGPSVPTLRQDRWVFVAFTDLYVRLVASGTIHDYGFHF